MKFNGARLRQLREERKLSQEELARLAKVALGSIKNWETGKTNPRDPEAVSRVASVLGANASTFFDFDGRKNDRAS
jgi:transcriptional regulator with XRE-family HTH domain